MDYFEVINKSLAAVFDKERPHSPPDDEPAHSRWEFYDADEQRELIAERITGSPHDDVSFGEAISEGGNLQQIKAAWRDHDALLFYTLVDSVMRSYWGPTIEEDFNGR